MLDIEGKLSAIAAAEAFSCQKNDGTDQVSLFSEWPLLYVHPFTVAGS